jgi:hypothetical protein
MAYLDGVFFRAVSNGTGDFVVASAIQGYQTPAAAGAVNAGVYGYRAESDDLTQWEYGTTTYNSSGTSCSRTVLGNSAGTTAKISFTLAPKVGFVDLAEQLSSASNLTSGIIPSIARIATGAADGSKYVRDDQTLAYPLKGVAPVATDWNDVQTPGVWTATGLSNAPDGINGWFYVEVLQHVGYVAGTQVYLTQTATGLTFQGKWSRTCNAGTWGAWHRLDTVRAWVHTDSVGNIYEAYNVSSVSNPSSGNITVNFTVAIASANYSVFVTANESNTGGSAVRPCTGVSQSTTAVSVRCVNGAGTLVNPAGGWNVAIFGAS